MLSTLAYNSCNKWVNEVKVMAVMAVMLIWARLGHTGIGEANGS